MTLTQSPIEEVGSRTDGMDYVLLPPLETTGTWGVRVVDEATGLAVNLYGFASDVLARIWIEIFEQADHFSAFPHLRMSWAMYRWSQRTGVQLPEGEAERISEQLW